MFFDRFPVSKLTCTIFVFPFCQKQVAELRSGMKEIFATSDEVFAALEKVRLAKKLECSTEELVEKKMACPRSKLGMVIGKNGSKIKQIQTRCKVSIHVEADDITIIGSEAAIRRATTEIDNIIRSQEEEIELEKLLIEYLTSKYVPVLRNLQEEYSSSFVDVQRSNGKLIVRGSPEDVAEIKGKVLGLRIVSRERILERREVNTIVGKKGSTIERLCTEHNIPIEISKESDTESNAVFVGPLEMVEAALRDVEKMLGDNRDVENTVSLTVLKKNILLAEGGRHIKAIQEKLVKSIPDGNCFLTVNQSVKDHPEAVVRAKQLSVSDALQFVVEALKELDNNIITRNIDPYIAPRIIGKGGEKIKKITGGKPFFLEVDKVTGELSFGATSAEGLEELKIKIDEIIESNCVLRVDADSAILRRQYRELSRSKMKNDLNGICWFDIDVDNSCFIVRGKKEDLDKSKPLLDQFISNNQFAEIPITDEDRNALLSGGKNSKIAKLSEEMGVNLHVDRATFCLIVRGNIEKVDKATKKIGQFLNGGEGCGVMKFTLSEQVVGVVIGRGGKTRQQLEQKHQGVTINISKAHVVTIRGPSEAVSSCRVEIAKLVASARVSQSITISEEEKASLEKKEYTKKIFQQTPVNLTTTNNKIVVKGAFHDVRDAVSLLNEMLTGEYKTFIELDAPQFSKVRNAVRDPAHFDRIRSACGTKLELDLTAGSIAVSGKRSNVRRAKDQIYGFLDFLLPNEFARLKIAKPLFVPVGKASVLAELSAEAGGVAIYLDRDLSLLVIRSSDVDKVAKATMLVKEKIKDAERLAYVFELSDSDSWIIPIIIGKKGEKVSILRKKFSGCKIEISKESRTISIVGESEEVVEEVRKAFVAAIEKARTENIFVSIQNDDVPYFLGKGGSHVKELGAKYGVAIQNVKKGNDSGIYRISGDAANVKTANEAVLEWLDMRQQATATLEMTLDRKQDISAIIGPKGAVARSIEEDFKCRIDIDKKSLVVKIRGPSQALREAALAKVKELIETYNKERIAIESAAKDLTDSVDKNEENMNEAEPGQNETRSANGGEFSQYPVSPVGISPMYGKSKKKKVNLSVNDGTDTGNYLLALLTSKD